MIKIEEERLRDSDEWFVKVSHGDWEDFLRDIQDVRVFFSGEAECFKTHLLNIGVKERYIDACIEGYKNVNLWPR